MKQTDNNQVRLSVIDIKSKAAKPMIVMHGFLGSKVNFRTLCAKPDIS